MRAVAGLWCRLNGDRAKMTKKIRTTNNQSITIKNKTKRLRLYKKLYKSGKKFRTKRGITKEGKANRKKRIGVNAINI